MDVSRQKNPKKYIHDFKVVTRVRPGDTEEEDRRDEQVCDEELEMNKFNFAEVSETRIGGAVAGENEKEASDDSKDGARQAFAKARKLWQIPARSTPLQHPEPGDLEPEKLQKAFAAAAASQKQEYSGSSKESSDKDPSWTAGHKCAEQDIWQGLQTKDENNKEGKLRWKQAQCEILEKIRHRLCHELSQQAKSLELDEPLLWLMRGGPGAGKSMITKMLKELFRDVCGWQMGLEFQVAALQAVMARQLGGDTLHHACGINPFRDNKPQDDKSRGKLRRDRQTLRNGSCNGVGSSSTK
jgi:hypothetical protein